MTQFHHNQKGSIMVLRALAAVTALIVFAAGCSGAGSPSSAPASLPSVAAGQSATGTLTLGVATTGTAGTAGNVRKPAFISPSTTFATLWIDSTTPGFRVPCSPAGTNTCTVSYVSTAGSHTFYAEVDDSASTSGGGNVLADSSTDVTLEVGNNGSAATLPLNGVPAQVTYSSEAPYASGSSNCASSIPTDCFVVQYTVEDIDGSMITSPGILDELVCLNPAGATAGAPSQCPSFSATFSQFYSVVEQCAVGANGDFTISAVIGNQPPYLGRLTAPQLAEYSLVYPQGTLTQSSWPTYVCNDGSITASGPANGSLNLSSLHRQ